MKYDIAEIKSEIKNRLTESRYEHSLRVAETAVLIAQKTGGNTEKALVAGLLHDVGKQIPHEEMIRLLEESGAYLTGVETNDPHSVHGVVGAVIAMRDFEITDEEILLAIANHSGRPGMKKLEKTLLIADFTDKFKRENIPCDNILENDDIDSMMLGLLKKATPYCVEKGIYLAERTRDAFDYIIEKIVKQKESAETLSTLFEGQNADNAEEMLFDKSIRIYREHGLKFEHISNARDVGGYESADGKKIKKGLIFRSGNLAEMTENEADELYGRGVRVIVDLRGESEVKAQPDINTERFLTYNCPLPLPSVNAAEYRNRLLERKHQSFSEDEDIWYNAQYFKSTDMKKMYMDFFTDENTKKQLKRILCIFSEEREGGILFHCTSGKDRTGIVMMFILLLLGASYQTVWEDYYASIPYNFILAESMAYDLKKAGYSEDLQREARSVVGIRTNLIETVSDRFCSKYGSGIEYLSKELGFTENDRKALQARFTE